MLGFVQSNCANPIARSVLLAEFIDYEEPITHQQNSKMSEMVTATRYFCVSFSEYSAAAVVPCTKALCIRRMKKCTYFIVESYELHICANRAYYNRIGASMLHACIYSQ